MLFYVRQKQITPLLFMNIENLKQDAVLFSREVIESGFKRDIGDYIASLPAAQTSILALREISTKVLCELERVYLGDLPAALAALLPTPKVRPFTESPHDKDLSELVNDNEITQQDFYGQLASRLGRLHSEIEANADAISKIEEFITPYVKADSAALSATDLAIISIVFNHRETITSLQRFASTVTLWNKVLPVYHQLIKSSSPEDIRIVEVQNGSINLIINLDVDVAIDLAEIFKIGFQVFVAYLSYKKMIKPIVDSFNGNKKLISSEHTRETMLLDNIGEAVRGAISDQHKHAKKYDAKVDGTAIQKKIDLVTKMITTHIVQGNDILILALPEQIGQTDEETAQVQKLTDDLRTESTAARRSLREIPKEAHQKLLEAYGRSEDSDTSTNET